MRNKIYATLFVICLTMFVNHAKAQRFRAGFTAGFVATDIPGTDARDDDVDFAKAGFIVGGTVSTILSDVSTVQMEINYIMKGAEQHPDSNGVGYFKFSYNYVEIPLVYKYRIKFNMGKTLVNMIDLHAGLSIGKMVSWSQEGDNIVSTVDLSYLNQTDISALVGFGYNFSSHVNFSFRYSNSLNSVIKSNGNSSVSEVYTFNKGHNVVLHFMFQFTFGDAGNFAPVKG